MSASVDRKLYNSLLEFILMPGKFKLIWEISIFPQIKNFNFIFLNFIRTFYSNKNEKYVVNLKQVLSKMILIECNFGVIF